MEHTQIHPALKKGIKISITLANPVEFFVISFIHKIEIPMADMKVQVYFNSWKKKFQKK